MNDKLTHFDSEGNAIMVDVSEKAETNREALAQGSIFVGKTAFEAITNRTIEKGDVLAVARVAGIMAVKRTSELIPMCHPLLLNKITINYELFEKTHMVQVRCCVKMQGKTGVEMEALTGTTVALLTIYDMCKAVNKRMRMTEIFLVEKTGGKSGHFRFDDTNQE